MTLIIWCFAIYIASLILSAIFLSLLFWYEATNRPCRAIPPPPYKPLPVFNTIARYFVFHLIRPIITIAWFCLLKPKTSKSPHPPVILIHGIFSTRTSWYAVFKALVAQNFTVRTFGYPTLWGSMDATVERLESFVQKVKTETHSPKVTIVAHSLGGVVTRYWLAKYPHNYDALSGLITLCTPHSGSDVSTLLPNPFSKALNPTSSVITMIQEQTYEKFPCVAYVTNADLLVVPAERLMPPQNWELRVTPPIDHLEILSNAPVIESVIATIQSQITEQRHTKPTTEAIQQN